MNVSKISKLVFASSLILGLIFLADQSFARLTPPPGELPSGNWEGNCPALSVPNNSGGTVLFECQERHIEMGIERTCEVVSFDQATRFRTNCDFPDYL